MKRWVKTFFEIITHWVSSGELSQCVPMRDRNADPDEIPWELDNEKLFCKFWDLALPEFGILVIKINGPEDRSNIPAGAAYVYGLEGSNSDCVPFFNAIKSLMKAGQRCKFEGGNLGLNLKCFKPLKNLRAVEESHRYKRYIRGETLKSPDRTVGKGETWMGNHRKQSM